MAFAGSYLTRKDIDSLGTRRYSARAERVFVAAVGALKAQGFEVAVQDAAKGLIKTAPKLVAMKANAVHAVGIYRQYVVRFEQRGDVTAVIAEPRVFIGQRDVSRDSVWAMDGAEGERSMWARFFAELESLL